jgi:dihydrofolate synthase/folylpolyglutamate synthase
MKLASFSYFIAEGFESVFKNLEGDKQEIAFSADLLGVAMVYVLNLLGEHQVENSSIAIMTALVLANSEKRITSEAIHNALLTISWPGRFEIVDQEDSLIVIDGAHNLAGATVLRTNLDKYFSDKEIVFLLGVLKDKDIEGILHTLVRPDNLVVVTQPESQRAATPEFIANKVVAKQVEVASSIESGLARAKELAKPNKIVCIAGSLYLIGAVRKFIVK